MSCPSALLSVSRLSAAFVGIYYGKYRHAQLSKQWAHDKIIEEEKVGILRDGIPQSFKKWDDKQLEQYHEYLKEHVVKGLELPERYANEVFEDVKERVLLARRGGDDHHH